jgi:DNA-binding NarL/FixJ family response regulator
MAAAARIALVEDHDMVREALAALFERSGHRVVFQSGSFAEAQGSIPSVAPDVAVIDVHLPDGHGVELARRLLDRDPRLGVVICTGDDRRATLLEALDSGAQAVVLKQGPPEETLTAVAAVARGETYIAPSVRTSVVGQARSPTPSLSPREREVLRWLADGRGTAEVADLLSVSPETVKTHVKNLMTKLGAHTRVHALAEAIRAGQLDL